MSSNRKPYPRRKNSTPLSEQMLLCIFNICSSTNEDIKCRFYEGMLLKAIISIDCFLGEQHH